MKALLAISALALSGCAATKSLVDPRGLAIEADSSWQASGDFSYRDKFGRPYDGPIGRLAVSMNTQITKEITLRYGIEHRSYLLIDDRGEERATVGITWRPFP